MFKNLLLFTLIAGLTLGIISCSEDEEDMADTGITEITDPADLSDGEADFIATGDETFSFISNSSSWTKSGKLTVNGRDYAKTILLIVNETEDITITVEFFIHDPEAGFFGGKTPEAGDTYEVGLSIEEQSSEDTQRFADISVLGDNLITGYFNDTESTGSINIASVNDGVIAGEIDVKEIFGFDFEAGKGYHIDVRASFKSLEGE